MKPNLSYIVHFVCVQKVCLLSKVSLTDATHASYIHKQLSNCEEQIRHLEGELKATREQHKESMKQVYFACDYYRFAMCPMAPRYVAFSIFTLSDVGAGVKAHPQKFRFIKNLDKI